MQAEHLRSLAALYSGIIGVLIGGLVLVGLVAGTVVLVAKLCEPSDDEGDNA